MPHVLKYGVLAEAGERERYLLTLADEYRLALFGSYLAEHRETQAFRAQLLPDLADAERRLELVGAVIHYWETQIKATHSEVRDRNAVTDEQREQLAAARERRREYARRARKGRAKWKAFFAAYRAAWKAHADWKNVKSIEKRAVEVRRIDWAASLAAAESTARGEIDAAEDAAAEKSRRRYDAVDWNVDAGLLQEFADIVIPRDMERRHLSRAYQDRGLNSGTRGEIDAATRPKIAKDGPGIRYKSTWTDPPKPWRKLVVQFAGGLRVGDALAGRSKALTLSPHRRENSMRFAQQIGTQKLPQTATGVFRAHRPLREDDVIQRWALVIEQRPDDTADGYWKRTVHVTVARNLPPKSGGKDVLGCRLSWTRRKAGVEVARFWSATVNESLILPNWLLENRMRLHDVQAVCDHAANEALKRLGRDVRKSSGVSALGDALHDGAGDDEARRLHERLTRAVRRAKHQTRWATNAIRKIYETVAARLAATHGAAWGLDALDLRRLKQYATRDLLKEDRIPLRSRTLLAAVAPGKLKAAIQAALPASDEEPPEPPGDARKSDIFTSYVASLGPRGGRQSRCGKDRSRSMRQPSGRP